MQDSGDQFQTNNDELLTYSFTKHIPTIIKQTNKFSKDKHKYSEKHSLSILKPNSTPNNYLITSTSNLNKKPSNTNQGKIITIGQGTFKSDFQSGSLGEVDFKPPNTYKVSMDKQYNSNRISSWFYFRCEGLKGQVNFIITGFTKSTSLYNQGMKVCYRQLTPIHQQSAHPAIQWKRGGSKISYSNSHQNENDQGIFELKFTYLFKTGESCPVDFAYCFPYEYNRVFKLLKMLKFIQSNSNRNKSSYPITYESLGKTYEGRDIPLLTVGNPDATKSIVLSARVHPGQTVASFIIEGFLKQLVSESDFAKSIKEKYLFKIVPMINPDGVIRGHYRFSAAGYDLNRRWKHCYQTSHPEIFYLKNMIKKLNKQKKVMMYIDIHGHSRRKNVFFYGCCSKDEDEEHMSKPKEFPYLMQKIDKNYKYDYCTFSMSRDKEGTARIQMYRQLHIDHVYTLESSLCGPQVGGNYSENDYLNIGKSLMEGISIYFYEKPEVKNVEKGKRNQKLDPNKVQQSEKSFQKYLHILDEAKQELKTSPYLLNVGMNEAESGSDSQPQAGIIAQNQRPLNSTTLKLELNSSIEQRRQKSDQFKSEASHYETTKKSIKFNLRTAPNVHKNKNKIILQDLKFIVDDKIQNIIDEQLSTTEKKLTAKTFNNFYSYNSQNLNSLTTDSLSQKNERVHSKQVSRSFLQKLKNPRINSENPLFQLKESEQQEKKRLEIMNRNLLKTRQGVQYRRVKIMAQEMKRKATSFSSSLQPPIPVVRGITTVNNELNLNRKKIKSIAPSFYPQSRQQNRRFSVQSAYRNNKSRNNRITSQIASIKLFINGDQFGVKCKGNKIYI